MITGVENAGLVLAAFPTAIEGLKSYTDGLQRVKNVRRYREVLKQFRRELETEETKFKNTCLGLLEGMVNAAEIEQLMAEPGEQSWRMPELQEKLRQRLRPTEGTVENWVVMVNSLKNELEGIAKKFDINMGNQVPEKFNPRKALKIGILEPYRAASIAKIGQWNTDLDTLANGSNQPMSVPKQGSKTKTDISKVAEYHMRIQKHAEVLYSALKEKLEYPECKCKVMHLANMQLEIRNIDEIVKGPAKKENPRFHFMFLTDSQKATPYHTACWTELQLEHMDYSVHGNMIQISPRSRATRSRKDSFCSQLSNSNGGRTVQQVDSSTSSDLLPSLQWFDTSDSSRVPTPSLPIIVTSSKPSPPHRVFKSSFRQPRPRRGPRCSPSPLIDSTHDKRPVKRVAFKDCRFDDSENNDFLTSANEPSNLPLIECFCSTILTGPSIPSSTGPVIRVSRSTTCIGILVSKDAQRLRVWNLSSPRTPISAPRLVSLAHLISTRTKPHEKPTQYDRLILGVKLVSSVMQLSTTAWMQENWSAADIFFPEIGQLSTAHFCQYHKRVNILERPLVQRRFNAEGGAAVIELEGKDHEQDSASYKACSLAVIGCNQSLYSLGIILMELYHWQPFSDLQPSDSSTIPEMAARDLAEKFQEHAGTLYGDAVRRCIFGLDLSGEASLDREEFRKEVYAKIVAPLEENVKIFCQGEF